MSYSDSFSFVDPLYELSVFRTDTHRDVYSEIFGGEQYFEKLYQRLINTFEVNRLNFLKQSGLLFLVFPSATHTRFAHSLGCLTLATYALDNVWVKVDKNLIKLDEYLKAKNVREEFLISLLVHDIGHLPFSHYLEENTKIKNTFTNHEKITDDLLNKNTILYEKLKKKATESNSETIEEVLRSYSSQIEILKIREFLCENNNEIISNLVCGYLDLDRLDHYFRDSFFMGLKLASVNVRGFLNSIVLEDKGVNSKTYIRSDGIPHILHLLFGKEMLIQRVFDSDINRAYQSMYIQAVNNWIEKEEDRIHELPFMIEDVLVSNLMTCNSSSKLINQIYARKPYILAYKSDNINLEYSEINELFNEFQRKESREKDDFIISIPQKYMKFETAKEWLLSNIPIFEGGTLKDVHRDLFDYFQKQAERRLRTVRIYARNDSMVEVVEKKLRNTIDY